MQTEPPEPPDFLDPLLRANHRPASPITAPCCPTAKKLSERYRPQSLRDVIGQPAARHLVKLAAEPFATCRLLVGPPGVGKTTAALAFAAELGCLDPFTDLHVVVGSELSVDAARELWAGPLRFSARSRSGYKILIIEELERLSPQAQIFLKTGLETDLPPKTIVLATSNDTRKLDSALLQRFGRPLHFAGGASFAAAAICRMADIWAIESPDESPPSELSRWGWDGSDYSLRVAIDSMQDFLSVQQAA